MARRSASALYAPFLNSPRYQTSPVTAKPAQGGIDRGWYDPAKKWIRVIVEQESIHKIDRGWFERRSSKPVKGSQIARGDIFSPFLEEEYLARLRVALQGWSSLGHHTVVQFNNQEIVDVVWQGQVELVVDEEISSSLLSEDDRPIASRFRQSPIRPRSTDSTSIGLSCSSGASA